MRWGAVGAWCFAGGLACSHDWEIVPPTGADGGGVVTDGATTSSSSSGGGTSSSSSSGQSPLPPKQCPSDCSCSAGETCEFECTGDCTINCATRAICNIQAPGQCTVKNSQASADCSHGSYSCKALPNGKDIQCSRQ